MALTVTRSETSDIQPLPTVETETLQHPVQLIPDIIGPLNDDTELKTKIARIAQLPNITDWEILDRKGNLVLIHYGNDANMRELWWVRGLVVDVETERVIGDSFGYTSYAVCSKLAAVENILTIEDVDGVVHKFDINTALIKVAYEGVVLRVFWYDGQMQIITHRRMDTKGSRWGRSRTFLEMYKAANGPNAEDLFDTSKPYSSTMYMFMVVDQELITATRQRVEVPYIIHIASMEMDLGRPVELVTDGLVKGYPSKEVPGIVDKSFIHHPPTLTLSRANAHLEHGYYHPQTVTDERLTTGEALIIYKVGPNGHVEDVVKVYSPAFHHRFNLRGNNANLSHQFHTLTDILGHGKLTEKAWYQFSRQLIVFPPYQIKDIKEMYRSLGAILTLPQQADINMKDFVNREQRLHLLWLNFVLALPPAQQATALEYLEKYNSDKNELATWLKEYEANNVGEALVNATCEDNVKEFLLAARKQAKMDQSNGRRSKKGSVMGYPVIIKAVIDRNLDRSHGARIYALVRAMKIAKGIITNPLLPVVVPIPITVATDDKDCLPIAEVCQANNVCSVPSSTPVSSPPVTVNLDMLFKSKETAHNGANGTPVNLVDTIFTGTTSQVSGATTALIDAILSQGEPSSSPASDPLPVLSDSQAAQ